MLRREAREIQGSGSLFFQQLALVRTNQGPTRTTVMSSKDDAPSDLIISLSDPMS